jgi:cytoskeletal protein RodZ
LGAGGAVHRYPSRNFHTTEPLGQLLLGQPTRWLPKDNSKGAVYMDTTFTIIIVLVVLGIIGAILGLVFVSRGRAKRLHDHFGPEYDHTVQTMGGEKKAQTELEERQKHVETLDIRPLSASERERYLVDWTAVQSKFVDEPGQAIVAADSLIMEVMQARAYPVSDFEQRAADISVAYPALVSNYRAAREIAIKNEQHQADTEELRQAMIHYRSLFEELLGTEAVAEEEKSR